MQRIFLKARCPLHTGLIELNGAPAKLSHPQRNGLRDLDMEAIIVAVIAAVGGILAALVQKSRAENKNDHNVVATMLIDVKDEILNLHHKIDHVDEQVDKVDDQMHDHMMWHYKKSSENKSKVKGV
jgi:Na+-translocating ferredoxin:NAD+ oxidoreductase RnfG subunit